MQKIYTIGETVLDIIFKNNKPIDAKAGGSCLNTSVSLGRLKLPVNFISEYGNDKIGNYINDFLIDNNVNTDYIYKFNNGKTPLAIAFLNKKNEASYDFYKIYPGKRFNITIPDLKKNNILLFGSYFAVTKSIRSKLKNILNHAKKNNVIIIYDPNFRKAHLDELKNLKPVIIENIKYADIIRGSNEDFKNIFNSNNIEETYKSINDNNKILIYTANKKGVFLQTPNLKEYYKIKTINPVSTIGAGDNFNAGLIYSLVKHNITKYILKNINKDVWQDIIKTSIDFATEVCLSYDNYISQKTAERYKNKISKNQ